ncbi:MAG: RNB domain-containing ribonuclease [Acidobacteriota bacterium]
MVDRGLEPDFPPAASAQAAAASEHPALGDGVKDMRDLLWCSIDNDDSRDLDQLTAADELPGGDVRVLVAVADVDGVALKDSPIDAHARLNTTSVYTPAQIFPMLPERLSTDLTSLVASEDRAAMVVEMRTGADGIVRESTIFRAVVRNRAKLAYNSVAAWLEGRAPAPEPLAAVPGLDACLRLQDRIATAMRSERQVRGALTLASTETHAVFDGDTLTRMEPDEKNRAKSLIEDFMIAANGTAAAFLATRGFSSMRRVLRAPRRWDRLIALARELGVSLPPMPDAPALDHFLRARREADPDGFPDLSLSVVKMLGSGEYALVRAGGAVDGHFGLAVRDYAHSTAPNRRFPDLITQRLLKAAIAGQPSPYPDDELELLARHCTAQEDAADKVERQVRKSAAALLLSGRTGDRFDGVVTGVSDKGTYVRVFQPPVEGRVVRGEAGLDVGERVRVTLLATDVDRGFIDFARA